MKPTIYSILVFKTDKCFTYRFNRVLVINSAKISFSGFDTALYCCRLDFTAKAKRAAVSGALADYGFDFVFPEYEMKIGGNV